MKRIATGAAALMLSGCVTTHFGETKEMGSITTSCHEDWQFITSKYRVVKCTFENQTGASITAKIDSVKFSDTYRYSRWHAVEKPAPVDAMEERGVLIAYTQKKHDEGEAAQVWAPIIAGLAVGATVGAVSSSLGNDSTSAMGDGISAGAVWGATTALTDDDEIEAYKHRELARIEQMRDDNRIESQPFTVPAGLYVRRHTMLRFDSDAPMPCEIELCFSQPTAKCMSLPIHPARGDVGKDCPSN